MRWQQQIEMADAIETNLPDPTRAISAPSALASRAPAEVTSRPQIASACEGDATPQEPEREPDPAHTPTSSTQDERATKIVATTACAHETSAGNDQASVLPTPRKNVWKAHAEVFLTLSCLMVAVGGLAVGHAWLLNELLAPGHFLDANALRALTNRIAKDLDLVVLFACTLLYVVRRRRDARRWSTALTLCAAALVTVDLVYALPNLGELWAQMDWVAQRPPAIVEAAARMKTLHDGLLTFAAVAIAGVAAAVVREIGSFDARATAR